MDNYVKVEESMYKLVLSFLEAAKRKPLGIPLLLAEGLSEEELRFIQDKKYYVRKALYNSAGFKEWAYPDWKELKE